MRTVVAKICLLIIALTASMNSQAYESDTHLRLTYHLARAVGINDEVARFLAIGNQYIDSNVISSAMLFPSQRQLFHFPGDLDPVNIDGHGAVSIYAQVAGESKLSLATRNHALGSYLIYMGLVRGDLLLVSLGIHIKMDTYGHAGFSNLLGHLDRGHNPDRAFLEPKKYEEMIRAVVQTLAQVRMLLPASALDSETAIKYLNKHKASTFMHNMEIDARTLAEPTTVAEIILADTELQKIYREDIYKRYEYKKIALEKVYTKFKTKKMIKENIKFEEIFSDRLLTDVNLDATDVIKQILSQELVTDGYSIDTERSNFNIQKILGYSDQNMFLMKFNLERKRFENRLKQYFFLSDKAINAQNLTAEERAKLEQEKEYLIRLAVHAELTGANRESFVKARALELAIERTVEDIAFNLTKDLIPVDPRKYNEYAKQNFEGESDTRQFEVRYKDELYRRKFELDWDSNWILKPKTNIADLFKSMALKFKSMFKKIVISKQIVEWQNRAEKAAEQMFPLASSREKAQMIDFTRRIKNKAMWELTKFLAPALVPYFGLKYIQKKTMIAKANAKDHEVENMVYAVSRGKYKSDIVNGSKLINDNINRIRDLMLQCKMLFN